MLEFTTDFAILRDEVDTSAPGSTNHYERWASHDDHPDDPHPADRPTQGQFSSDSPMVAEAFLKIGYTDREGSSQVSHKSFSMEPANMVMSLGAAAKIRPAMAEFYATLGGTLQSVTLMVGAESLKL